MLYMKAVLKTSEGRLLFPHVDYNTLICGLIFRCGTSSVIIITCIMHFLVLVGILWFI